MHTLVLMRHGESTANLDGTFAGWLDVPLTAAGVEQAHAAGRALRGAGMEFDACYTSVLKRAIQSAWHTLEAMDRCWLPEERSWRLNERHYGALQGRSRADTVRAFGQEQVRSWRRSFDQRPPPLPQPDVLAAHDRRYADIPAEAMPASESMQDTVTRLLPLWHERIAPQVAAGRRVLVVAHGTTLRAFAVILGGMRPDEAESVEIPNALPVVYGLDAGLRVISSGALAAA